MKLRLATRGSALAWTQSGMVADALRALGHEVELVKITTHGDVTTAPLASLGGAGVFVGAVRAALLSGEADLAVHSFKDLPTAPAEGLLLGAVPPRENPADALCSRDGVSLADLPHGAKVGTGSPRRAAQLLALRPDLEIVEIRGNVETRLSRIDADLDAVVLAAAGLARLGLADRITEHLDAPAVLPAPAQGALAVECRADAPSELLSALAAIDDLPTRLSAMAERAVLARLEAGCAAPVAARATVSDGVLELTARVVATDGSRNLEASASAPAETDATAVGTQVAEQLLAEGAGELVNLAASKPRPLAGRRLLLPLRSPAGLADALTAAGADVVLAAFTQTEPLGTAALVDALAENWDWLVFSSAAAITLLTEQGFDLAGQARQFRIAAVGPATAAALRAAGLEPDLVAFSGGGAALAEEFEPGPGRVLMPGAQEASAEPAAGLRAKGWTVRPIAIYRTVALPLPAEVLTAWGQVDAVIVTAGSVARAAVAAAGLPGPKVIAIGGPSATVSRELGLEVVAVAASPTTGGLVDAVLSAL